MDSITTDLCVLEVAKRGCDMNVDVLSKTVSRILGVPKNRPRRFNDSRLLVLRLGLALPAVLTTLALAQNLTLSLEVALSKLPESLEWRSADLVFASVQARFDQALAATGFVLGANSDYSLAKSIDPNLEASQNLSIGVQASINLLPWSGAQAQIVAAQSALERARLERDEARNSLALNVVSQYDALRIAELDLELARAVRVLREHQFLAAQAQAKAGTITPDALAIQQQAQESARFAVNQALAVLDTARLTLTGTLGLRDSHVITSGGPVQPLPVNLVADFTPVFARRFDTRKATIMVHEAQAALEFAMLQRLLPDASLKLGYGQRDGLFGTASLDFRTGQANLGLLLTPVNINPTAGAASGTSFTLGASINLPILAPGKVAEIGLAQRNLDSAKQTLETIKRNAALEIRQRHTELGLALQRIELARTAQRLNAQVFETTRARFEAGLVIALEVEVAQAAVLQGNRDLEFALLNARSADLRLTNALGNLALVPAGNQASVGSNQRGLIFENVGQNLSRNVSSAAHFNKPSHRSKGETDHA
jgi:outer membrane protein